MEIIRFAIRKFPLQCWEKRLYLETIRWLKNQDPIEYDINVAAFYDALTQAMHSSWWEWLYGSWLYLWRCTYIWMREARDGARAFHLYFPPPKLRLYSPPIK